MEIGWSCSEMYRLESGDGLRERHRGPHVQEEPRETISQMGRRP